MATEETPVSGLLEAGVLQRKQKRKVNAGRAADPPLPDSHEDYEEFLRKSCHSVWEPVISARTTQLCDESRNILRHKSHHKY